MSHHHHDTPQGSADEFWEERYASADKVWSGNANQALVGAVEGLAPGRALDLGCGEGGDVLWLASRGWDAIGVDISATATRRGAEAAAAAGLGERAHFVAADLSAWTSDDSYDLVTASFLQSPVALARDDILQRAAERVVPGGHLLVIAHAAMPPWAQAAGHENHDFIGPEDEVAALGLPAGPRWPPRCDRGTPSGRAGSRPCWTTPSCSCAGPRSRVTDGVVR